MTTVVIVLASLLTYVVVGWWVARRDLPAAIAAARQHWNYDNIVADSAACRFALVWMFWPAAVPVVVVSRTIRDEVERSDPVRLRRRIHDLERELDLDRRTRW